MGSWWYGHLLLSSLYLSEITAFARYLPVTPELPVTSETCPLTPELLYFFTYYVCFIVMYKYVRSTFAFE